jgi:hypothetical protein
VDGSLKFIEASGGPAIFVGGRSVLVGCEDSGVKREDFQN